MGGSPLSARCPGKLACRNSDLLWASKSASVEKVKARMGRQEPKPAAVPHGEADKGAFYVDDDRSAAFRSLPVTR